MKTINISEETYELIKEQLKGDEKTDVSSIDDMIGKKFFFRTVTYHIIGLVSKVMGKFLILEGAAWVADSGRFMNALKNGTLSEVEPCGVGFINLDTVTDFYPWNHDLPRSQK